MTDERALNVERYSEWGYRLPDGREVWEIDHSNGRWTPNMPSEGISSIDVDAGTTASRVARLVRGRATVLSREVTVTRGAIVEHTESCPSPKLPTAPWTVIEVNPSRTRWALHPGGGGRWLQVGGTRSLTATDLAEEATYGFVVLASGDATSA